MGSCSHVRPVPLGHSWMQRERGESVLRTNSERLVMSSVQGCVAHPIRRGAYRIDADGSPFILPGTGGITYNVKVGDPAFGWAGDHIEPAVSTVGDFDKRSDVRNIAYNVMACVGNEARVVSGDAKGAIGVVTGHHGGIEHVLIDFDNETLEKLAIDDRILIKAVGQGLRLEDFPEVTLYNLAPTYLHALGLEVSGGKLAVPVAAIVPARLMGSGIGAPDSASGDYDITTGDREEISQLGLDRLRLGDIVALEDCDNRFGRCYRRGAMSIGIIVHSDCLLAGHGPGVATLMTTIAPIMSLEICDGANIAHQLRIGRARS